MDKLTNAFHTQMAEEKQKLWQLIKEKGSAGQKNHPAIILADADMMF